MKTTNNLLVGLCVCFICFSEPGIGSNFVLGDVESSVIIHFNEEQLPTQKFREPFTTDMFFDIARGVRAKIAQDQEERSKIVPLLQAKRIDKRVDSLLTEEKKAFSLHNRAYSLGYKSDELKNFALLSSTTVSWGKGIRLLEQLTGKEGIFPKYSFEDAVSILFLKIEDPNILYRSIFSSEYQKERDFYTKSLAFALKKVWETTRNTTILLTSTEKNKKSAAENILTQIYDELYHQH